MGVGVSLAWLASAVSKNGGLGIISAVTLGLLSQSAGGFAYLDNNLQALREQVREARKLTEKPIGVNIMVALTEYEEYVKVCAEEKVEVVCCGGGLPLNMPACLPEGCRTKAVPIVSSPRAAKLLLRKWSDKYSYIPDAVVLEGPMAGGHLGFSVAELNDPNCTLWNLIPPLKETLDIFSQTAGKRISLIAGGGVFSGAEILRALELGADGVQMGTRFVATDECDVSPAFKDAYVACKQEDLTLIESPVGMPGRAIRNEFLEKVAQGQKHPENCPWRCLVTCKQKDSPYCIARALLHARQGNLANGFVFAGANAYRVTEVVPVAKLMETLEQEFAEAVKSGSAAAPKAL